MRDEREREIFDRWIHWLKGNEFAFIQFNSNGRWTERRRDVFCSRIILSQPRASLEIQISPFGWMMRRGSGRTRKGGGGGEEEEDKKTWVNAWSSLCIRLASAEDAADYRYLLLTAVKAIVLETWLSTKEALQSFLRPSCDLMEPFVFSLKFLFLPAYRCIFFISFDSKKKFKTKGKFRRIARFDRKIIIFIY